MGIKRKFMLLTALIGVVLLLISAIGYYTAQKSLSANIEEQLDTIVDFEAEEIDGWLMRKGQNAIAVGVTLGHMPPGAVMQRELLSCVSVDSGILNLVNGNEDGQFVQWGDSQVPPGWDPRKRGWYQEAKAAGGLVFTDAYADDFTGKMVVTAAYPYKDAGGAMRGALCCDVSLEALAGLVDKIKLDGAGVGFIVDKSGLIVAHADPAQIGKKIGDDPALKARLQEIMTQECGMFQYEENGEDLIFAYAKAKQTGWVVGVIVPEDVVYGELAALRVSYGMIAVLGILILAFVCWRFAGKITRPILSLTAAADKLAAGDLRVEKLPVETADELGSLTASFNAMSDNLRGLIGGVTGASAKIAASSEELTASAGQSADAANHVAGTITEVADGTTAQLRAIEGAQEQIDCTAGEIDQVAVKTGRISEISGRAAEQAQTGQTVMASAVHQMESIERAVNDSAATVVRLGDNSKQIEQIVSVISGIAGQTNLLALNAAIEAARAGEQGKGFAVVAEEVRKLAEQSRQATEEIAKLIATIQQDTEQAVRAMEMGTGEVKTGSAAIHNVGDTFRAITEIVAEITAEIQGISQSVQRVTDGSGAVVAAVKEIRAVSSKTVAQTETISAATQQQSAAMEEIAASAHTLAEMADNMQEMVKKFRL